MPIFKKKGFKIIVITAAVVLVLGIILMGYYQIFMNPYRETVESLENSLVLDETMTKAEAVEDLNYLYGQMKEYHPAYLDGSESLTQEVMDQYNKELAAISDSITVLELWQAAGRIAASMQDGHTFVKYVNPGEFHYIADITPAYEYGDPIAVNGVDINELFMTFQSQFSHELDFYAEDLFFNTYLYCEEYLQFCGVDTTSGVLFTYQTEDGTLDHQYEFTAAGDIVNTEYEEIKEWVYYTIDTDNNLGIFTLEKCVCDEEYLSVLDAFFKEVAENGITNIAVDLRGNGGGNSWVANEFLTYIDVDSYNSWENGVRYGRFLWMNKDVVCNNDKKDVVYQGKIYVITDVRTYSSGMDFAMLIGDNDIGELVGATSGNMPNSYGDCLYFQMPNSKLQISVSFKKWCRVDQTKADEPLIPDYEVSSAMAMEKVYELISIEKYKEILKETGCADTISSGR